MIPQQGEDIGLPVEDVVVDIGEPGYDHDMEFYKASGQFKYKNYGFTVIFDGVECLEDGSGLEQLPNLGLPKKHLQDFIELYDKTDSDTMWYKIVRFSDMYASITPPGYAGGYVLPDETVIGEEGLSILDFWLVWESDSNSNKECHLFYLDDEGWRYYGKTGYQLRDKINQVILQNWIDPKVENSDPDNYDKMIKSFNIEGLQADISLEEIEY